MDGIIFKRKIYDKILHWKTNSNGETAMLIQGARRIGKSTIVREFAKNEYKSFIAIDFSQVGNNIKNLFEDPSQLDYIFLMLQNITGVTLYQRESVIIFDEIQLFPPARQIIKHLVNDGRYDYIETGSLLSIKKNVKDILIPSEETRINMYPMDFEEFLWAIDKTRLFEVIKYHYNHLKPLGDAMHRSLMKDFRLYMCIGGMPQAINAYLRTNDMRRVDEIKRNILDLYAEDFRKIDPLGRITELFRSIPSELARNTMRYKVGSVIDNATADRLAKPLMEMSESMTVNFAYHANDPSSGLSLHANRSFFKLFLADTGLFITLAFRDNENADNEIYNKLMLDKLQTDLGYVYENVVAQLLHSSGNELFYYTFKGETTKNYEIDFLLSRGGKICPIEVKSSSYKAHKSLDLFQDKYHSRISRRYLIYTRDLSKDQDIILLPVYMTGLIQ